MIIIRIYCNYSQEKIVTDNVVSPGNSHRILTGALAYLALHMEGGCPRSAYLASLLLNRIADDPQNDTQLRSEAQRLAETIAAGDHYGPRTEAAPSPPIPRSDSSSAMTQQLRLAAIIALLSSSALRGTTASKSAALCMHLETLLKQSETLDHGLQETLAAALKEWKLAAHIQSCPPQHRTSLASAPAVLH